jgi:hypothetical protein
MHRSTIERKSQREPGVELQGEYFRVFRTPVTGVRFTDMPLRGKRCSAVRVQFKLA